MQKKSKYWPSPKGLVHGFGQKIGFFDLFILGKIGKKKGFGDIVERKKRLSRL